MSALKRANKEHAAPKRLICGSHILAWLILSLSHWLWEQLEAPAFSPSLLCYLALPQGAGQALGMGSRVCPHKHAVWCCRPNQVKRGEGWRFACAAQGPLLALAWPVQHAALAGVASSCLEVWQHCFWMAFLTYSESSLRYSCTHSQKQDKTILDWVLVCQAVSHNCIFIFFVLFIQQD